MKKHSLKLLSLLLAMVMVIGLLPAAAQATELGEGDVVILYTNDVHTYIDEAMSYATVAELKDSYEEAGNNVLLVDAGDHIQGTAYGSMDKGKTIIDLMNAAGYDAATLGNHEFDYGMDGTMNVLDWANFPYLSCNFQDLKTNAPVLDAYKVFTFGDVKVAFVGITTPESFTKSTPAYFQDENGNYIYDIFGGEDGAELYEAAQQAIDAAALEADYVIALGHLGIDEASAPWTSLDLIANTTGLDAFIDGHSHSTVASQVVVDKDGNEVLLTQTGEYFGAIGKMIIAEDGTITTELITDYAGTDEAVAELQDAWITEIDEKLGEVIGHAEVTFDNYDADGNRLVRKQETNTGDFAADALYYLFDNMGLDVDVAIMNGGGVRNKAITGDFSYKTCKEIHTFGNVACLQTITGQQLLDALEWGARDTTDMECGGFLHVSGITYDIRAYLPTTVQKDEKGVWVGGPTGGYRVHNVQVRNNETGAWEPLDLEAKYNLAGYNYTLRDLGDGFAMFDGAVNVLDYVMEDYMVLANYVKSFAASEDHNGLPTITAENSAYGEVTGEGRITIETAPQDVSENQWYYDEVIFVYDQGLMNGVDLDNFAPNGIVTRAQVVQVLYRMAGEPAAAAAEFADIAAGRWYSDAVAWAAEIGLVLGYPDGTFRPDRAVTREEMVTMFYRLGGLMGWDIDKGADLSSFKDTGDVHAYALPAMEWAVRVGLIQGVGNDCLEPRSEAIRAQMAAILFRVYNAQVEVNLLATSDVHGQIYPTDYTAGYAASGNHHQSLAHIATAVKEQRAEHENTFLVDCGDLVQGTPMTYHYAFDLPQEEDPAMKALRLIGYDMFVAGNHEFNYGMGILRNQLNYLTSAATDTEASVAVSLANYLAAETNNDETKDWATWNGYAPYKLYNYDGMIVAVMGIGNPNVPKWDVPANWEGIYFANPVDTYKHYEAEMVAAADLIVLASHSGIDSDDQSDYIRRLVESTDTIDLVFTGHEHRTGVTMIENTEGVEIPVFSLNTKCASLGKALVSYNKITGEYETETGLIAMSYRDNNRVWHSAYEADQAFLDALAPYETETWQNYMLLPIGTATGDFPAANLGGAPSAFVQLINDVQTWGAYDRTGENTPDDTSDDVAPMLSITAPLTSGSNPNLIPEGEIVLGDLFALYRYENWFYQITMSGKEVDTWLEYSASKVALREDGSVNIIGGLTYYDVITGAGFYYEIDPAKPEGDRVTITYNDQPVADDFVFTVVVNNYRYNGGGNYVQYLNDHGCEFIANDPDRIIYSTQYDMIQGEDKGQARNLLADYIREAEELDPADYTFANWRIIGAN